jgi:hypothetical protein
MQPAVDTGRFAPESPILDQPLDQPLDGKAAAPVWSLATRLLFRFGFSYLVLYNFPFPLDYIPYVDAAVLPYYQMWKLLVPWVGSHLFHVDATTLPNGSGDTTWGYVQVFCYLVIALLAAAVWSILDRKRKSYPRLCEGLRIYIRFALGATMISYGAVKVIKSQFPDPSADRLLQPYGDASPMGLLWTFMGASAAYNVFSGLSEMIGGLLLAFRRTALLGALVSFGVMLNIVLLNFCYDVPVKLFSCHLLAMAIFLTLPDLRRLTDLLVLNRRVEAAAARPFFTRPWLRRGITVLTTLAVVALTAFHLSRASETSKLYGSQAPKGPLSGIWEVDEMSVDGQIRPPLTTDTERWRRVIVGSSGQFSVQRMDDFRDRYLVETPPKEKTGRLELTQRFEVNKKSSLAYALPTPGLMTLQGTWEGRRLQVRLHRVEPPKFLLTTRGFHWINERPFNR